MKAENFVFKGKFFVYSKDLNKIKNALIDFLEGEGYRYISPLSFFYNFASMTFMRYTPQIKIPFYLIKKYMGIISEQDLQQEIYFKSISRMRDDIPYEIDVLMYFGKLKDLDGIVVEVISKPTIYFKITQLLWPTDLVTRERYSFISIENKNFIEKIARALYGKIIEDPKPLNIYVTTQIIEKLKSFGFAEVAEMLRRGKEKIESGDSDGLDDLRGAIENFLYCLIQRLNEKPSSLHECEKNIEKLETMGYIDKDIKRLIQCVLYKGVYIFISNVKTHPRKDVDLFISRLCFDLTENIFDSLVERIIRYKIKTSENKGG